MRIMDSKWNPQNDRGHASHRKPTREYAGRLKPQSTDPLERVGLPSKGDTSLSEFVAQESYFSIIQERCEELDKDTAKSSLLEDSLAKLSLNPQNTVSGETGGRENQALQKYAVEKSTLLSAMRKLREAIVATSRHDAFARKAYIYICRSGIIYGDMETYHPAMLHLLQVLRLHTPLTRTELEEFVGYRVLDLCCRSRDFNGAYRMLQTYSFLSSFVMKVLKALVQNDWILYWRMWRRADECQKKLMEYAIDHMRQVAIGAITRSYFTIDKVFAEASLGPSWSKFIKESKLAWYVEAEKVVVRRRSNAK